MIGYYVHHHGRGHLHRATALCRELAEPVTGLSTLERPDDWPGAWVQLPRDDTAERTMDVTARGRLHWAPRHDPGVLERAGALSQWLVSARPRLVVVDVSAEVSLLVRLHGVPVVGVVQPGRRTDPTHDLAMGVADTLVAPWPPGASGMVPRLDPAHLRRLRCLGAVSRIRPRRRRAPHRERHVVVLQGRGADGLSRTQLDRLARLSPGWTWTVLGGAAGTWVDDPTDLLAHAAVVVTHAGQSALADVAALRVPAVVVPADRPFDEQHCTGAALARGRWPALVVPDFAETRDPAAVLDEAAALDGERWRHWCDGRAAARFATQLASTGSPTEQPAFPVHDDRALDEPARDPARDEPAVDEVP